MSHTPQTKEGTSKVCGASFPIKSEGVCVHPEVLIADTLWDYMNCPACGCQLLLSQRCRDINDPYYTQILFARGDEADEAFTYFDGGEDDLAAAEDVLGAEE